MPTQASTSPTTDQAITHDEWLSLEDAARYAAVHVSTLRRLIKAGILRHARVGPAKKAIRVRRSWIDQALQPVEAA